MHCTLELIVDVRI